MPKNVKDRPKLILVGNPNTGKSLIFNYLTQQYVTVSNYPGTTVDVTRGLGKCSGQEFIIIDTPGTNSLLPQSEDEAITRRLILSEKPQAIIQVVDSKALKRSLNLTQELSELGIPLILDLNMSDEAGERGIQVDVRQLAQLLGTKVVETVATTRVGLAALRNNVGQANQCLRQTVYSPEIEKTIEGICGLLPESATYKRFIALAILSGDEDIFSLIGLDRDKIAQLREKVSSLQKEYAMTLKLVIQTSRENRSKQLTERTVSCRGPVIRRRWQELLGRLALRPITAVPMAVLLLFIMYKFVGEFAAGTMVDFLQGTVFEKAINPWFINACASIGLPGLFRDFLVGEYGVITMALTYSLAIIFPIVTAFFIFFGTLEDSGYLPRLCVLLDRLFHPIGLNGRAVLPLVLGLGCGTMATLTTRTLYTRRERILATLLLALAIPCSAQLGVILGILGGISPGATFLWLSIIIFSGFVTGFIASRVLPGRRPGLIQEIPPMRVPQFSNILLKTWIRLKWYLKEAVPLFILGTVVLFLFNQLGILRLIENLFRPLVTGLLSLPAKVTEVFLVGFLRRDYGAAGLYMLTKTGQVNHLQALVSLVVITLFVPCIAQFFVSIRERGLKVALGILSFTSIFAFTVGGLLNFVLRSLHIAL